MLCVQCALSDLGLLQPLGSPLGSGEVGSSFEKLPVPKGRLSTACLSSVPARGLLQWPGWAHLWSEAYLEC